MDKSPNIIDRIAVTLANLTIKFRWLVIILALLGSVALGSGASNLVFSSNYRAFFSPDNPELRNFEDFQATYVKSDNFLFVLVPKDGRDIFEPETLSAVADMTEKGWTLPYVTRVDSVTNFQYTYAEGDELIVEDLVAEPDSDTERLAQIRAAAMAEPLLNGQIVARDSQATAVNLVLTYPEQNIDEVPTAVAAARALRAEIQEAYPHLEIYLTGTSMLNNAFSEAILSDFGTLIPIMFLVITIMTIIAVRSVGATLATLLVVALSSIAAMGWAGFVGIQLAGPSPSATIVILTLAIADSIHVLMTVRTSMRAGMAKREAIIDSLRINFLAVGITSLTTIVGFLALNFSDSPPFRDFGNISAVGIFFAWLFSITLLPAVLSLIPIRVKAKDEKQTPIMERIADFVIARYRVLFVLFGGTALVLTAFIPQIILSDQFKNYFAPRIEFRADSDKAIEHFGFYPMEFSVHADEAGGVSEPEFLATLEEFSEWLRTQPRVTHVYSLSDIMKRLNKNLNGDNPDFYRTPADRELSAQYLLLFELSLPYGLDLNDRVNIDKSATRVTATLDGNASTREIKALIKNAEAWFEENAPSIEAPATGPQVMFTFIAQRNVESMISGTLIAVLAIAVIMMFTLRSIWLGALSMVPNGLPILAAFGLWAILFGEIGFSVAAVASLSLGIVIDDTVHFLTKFVRARRERGLDVRDSIRYAFTTVGGAIVINTVILMSGFAILTASAFKINFELGLLTTMTIGLALILDLLFLPALLILLFSRKTQPHHQGDLHENRSATPV